MRWFSPVFLSALVLLGACESPPPPIPTQMAVSSCANPKAPAGKPNGKFVMFGD